MEFVNSSSNYLLNKKQINQKSDEWYNLRKKIITATDVSSILNLNKYKSKVLLRSCDLYQTIINDHPDLNLEFICAIL